MSTQETYSWPDSLWRATAIPLDDLSPLIGDITTDVAIIGAGYTGLSTALHLAEAGTCAVVIDKVQPGWGCSGRNGGQINPNWKVLPEKIRQYYSEEEFEQMIAIVTEACDCVFDLVKKYNIQCETIRPGYILGVVGKSGMSFIDDWIRQWRILGADVERLNRSDMAKILGTNHYDGGMFDRRGGSLQPLSFARGLAIAAISKGATIYGNTPANSFHKTRSGWQIRTPKGNINCRNLVIGTNGYTDKTWPGLAQAIVPVATMITATAPLPKDIARQILPQRNAVSEAGGVPLYYRIDEQNRMVFGGRGNVFGKLGTLDTAMLRRLAVKLFPQLETATWEYDWGGYVAMTTHHRSLLLKLDDHAYSGLGYNGRGLAMATMMGKQLALAVRGEATGLPIEKPWKIPLHQFHNLGIAGRIIGGHIKDTLTPRYNP